MRGAAAANSSFPGTLVLLAVLIAMVTQVTWLDWSRLGPMAERYHALIDADVKRDTRKLESYEDFVASLETDPRSLKAFADQRRAYLLSLPAINHVVPAAVSRAP